MKFFHLAIVAMLFPFMATAQHSIRGIVNSKETLQPLSHATILLQNGQTVFSRVSGYDGAYRFDNLSSGNYRIKVSIVGYQPYETTILINADSILNIGLEMSAKRLEGVTVTATRASARSPFTFLNIAKQDIEKNNLGQDLPYLLNQTPSVVVSSDAGAGIGYTDIRVRGSDATRINVTINGIPLNNPESQGSFFINLPDFASSVDNIQLQRGIGTSTNGAGAFGASINIQTDNRRDTAYAELDAAAGSFGTLKNTVRVGSGLLNNKFSLDGRLSRITSEGYIDRASSRLQSFFLSGAWYGKESTLRANVFSGTERTYLAWGGVPDHILGNETIDGRRSFNELGKMADGSFYKDQTDNYQQTHYQLLYDTRLSQKLIFNGALHYTKGKGYYEEYRIADQLEAYRLPPVIAGSDTIKNTDLVRRLHLDNDFYGLTYALKYFPSARSAFTLGGAYNEYKGRHFGRIVYASQAIGVKPDHQYYRNDGKKTDFNVFVRGEWEVGKFLIYGDMQFRHIYYSFLGFDRNLNKVQQNVSLNFYNPKVGVTHFLNSRSNIYASLSVGNREPNRDDYINSSPQSRPKSEHSKDLELGYRYGNTKFSLGVNGFLMLYTNQLILTGALNDVGEAVRTNIAKSYRTGIEIAGKVRLTDQFNWNANLTISRNKVKGYRQFLFNADNNSYVEQQYGTTNLALSPSVIAGSEIVYSPFKNTSIAFISKYVSRQYLDNTSGTNTNGWTVNPADAKNKYAFHRYIDGYLVNDLRVNHNFKLRGIKQVSLTVLVNNIFSEKYESKGVTYANIQGGFVRNNNSFFVQAPINVLAGVSIRF